MQMLSLQVYWTCTVWNFLDFSVTQILREINFGKSRSSKTADFAILGALNFVHVVNFCLKKCKHSKKVKFRASQFVKIAYFQMLDLPTLISRKI